MKLLPILYSLTQAQDCNIQKYQGNLRFYGCQVKSPDGLSLVGDNGKEIFDGAQCRRAVCAKTKEVGMDISCTDGKLRNLPECPDMNYKEANTLLSRLSSSGSSGLSHTSGAVTGQARPSSYPDAILLYGSFTPRKFDANRVKFPVMGVYKKYSQKNIATRYTDDHPVYKHESEPLFLAYYSMNKSWRITSRDNIAKDTAFCQFKADYGMLHDPTNFPTWISRECFMSNEWRPTDLIFTDVSSNFRVRQRLCPDGFSGLVSNAHSMGRLEIKINGEGFSKSFTLTKGIENKGLPIEDDFGAVDFDIDDIKSVEGKFDSTDALCLSELTVMKGGKAYNLLTLGHESSRHNKFTIGTTKKSNSWMMAWWDADFWSDAAWPPGKVALVNKQPPKDIQQTAFHYFKFVDSFREFWIPRRLETLTSPPPVQTTKRPLYSFAPLAVTTPKTTTTEAPRQVSTTAAPSSSGGWVGTRDYCDLGDLTRLGIHASMCKFTAKNRHLKPSDSSSNQGRFGNTVLNGAQCKFSCADYPRKPFNIPGIRCSCSRPNKFNSLSDMLASQTSNPCKWYKAGSKQPLEPNEIFPGGMCPMGCFNDDIKAENSCSGDITDPGKTCKLTCPGRKTKPVTRCAWNAKFNEMRFSKTDCGAPPKKRMGGKKNGK